MTSTAALLAATRFERRTLNWLCNDFSSNVHFQLLQGHPLDPRFCKQVPLTWQNWHVMWATWRYSKNPSEQNLGSDMTAVTSYPVHILMNKKNNDHRVFTCLLFGQWPTSFHKTKFSISLHIFRNSIRSAQRKWRKTGFGPAGVKRVAEFQARFQSKTTASFKLEVCWSNWP